MEKNITALFEVNVPKTAKTLAKFVSKDTLRPQYLYICIEPGRGFMTATDMSELRVINIEAAGEWPEGARILVDPKHIAKIAGKTATVTVGEFDNHISVEIEADGETYVTGYKRMNYPDVKRVIPPKENRPAIRLTAESVEALKTICKLSRGNYITLSVVEGTSRLIVCDEVRDYAEERTAFAIKLAEPAEKTITVSLNPVLLSDCLTGSNGVILVDEPYKPVMFEGDADATILMPMCVNDRDAEFVGKVRDNSILAASTFAEDVAEVARQLKKEASELWQSILKYNAESRHGQKLIPGNYTAKDIIVNTKAKCGYYAFPDYADYAFPLEVKHGNIYLTLNYSELFSILSFWESATRSKKSVFAVGQVEEVTATVLEGTDEGAAEKKMKLRKLGGNWYCDAKRGTKDYDVLVYYQLNGVIFSVDRVPYGHIDDSEKWAAWVESHESRIMEALPKVAEHQPYYAEICRLAGICAATPEEAKANIEAARIKREKEREENQRKEAERIRQKEEAEECRKAKLLAEGKKKLLSGEKISVEQIELIAENVGYKINIRTLGFMREKVIEVALLADNRVNVHGYKLTHRNLSGTADVLREIAARIKAQAEQEAQQPATPAEMPQIVKVEIVRDFDGSYYANLTDTNGDHHALSAEYVSYNKLKSLCRAEYGIEFPNRASLNFKQYGRKEFAYYTPQSTETPQISTETAEAVNVSAEGEKREETANMPIIYNCEWQTIEDFKKIPNISKLANTGIIINGVGYHTEYCNSKFETLARVDNLPWDMDRHDFPYQGSGIFGKTELFDNWKDAVIATIDTLTDYLQKQTPPEPIKEPEHLPQLPKSAPQSRKTLPAVNYATPTPKECRIARKQPNSAIRKFRTTQHNTLRTANSPPIGRPHRTLTSGNIKRIY